MPEPSREALDYLEKYGCWVGLRRIEGVARLLDGFHANRLKATAEANREALATYIRNWVEELQPDDLRNRSTADLQDELQRRQAETFGKPVACPHGFINSDDCVDCRH